MEVGLDLIPNERELNYSHFHYKAKTILHYTCNTIYIVCHYLIKGAMINYYKKCYFTYKTEHAKKKIMMSFENKILMAVETYLYYRPVFDKSNGLLLYWYFIVKIIKLL